MHPTPPIKSVLESANPAWTRSVHLDAPGQWHGQQPVSGTADPGVVQQDKSSRGSVDTTNTRSGPQRVRMSSGERPIGAAKGKQSDTKALCQTPPPHHGRLPCATVHSGHIMSDAQPLALMQFAKGEVTDAAGDCICHGTFPTHGAPFGGNIATQRNPKAEIPNGGAQGPSPQSVLQSTVLMCTRIGHSSAEIVPQHWPRNVCVLEPQRAHKRG